MLANLVRELLKRLRMVAELLIDKLDMLPDRPRHFRVNRRAAVEDRRRTHVVTPYCSRKGLIISYGPVLPQTADGHFNILAVPP